MKHTLILLFVFFSLGFVQDFSPQSKAITEKFFPEIAIDHSTPALKKEKGYTQYEELIDFLNVLQVKHPSLVRIQYIGESQKGKAIPLVYLNKKSKEDKLKVWLQGGLHGDEMASTEGVLYLLEKLLNDSGHAYLLDRLDIAIVPMANIDGYEKQNRYAANGLDLNRDQTKLLVKESVILKQAFSNYNPDVAVDFHEYRPYRKDFAQLSTFGVTSRYDVMFMSSGNLNVPEKLRTYTNEKFVKNAESKLNELGITHREYLTSEKEMGSLYFNQGSNNARSSATSYALANTVASLIEVRGVGLGRTSFKRRIFTTYQVGLSYLKTAYHQVQEVKEILKPEVEPVQQAVITSRKEITKQNLKVIDLETSSEISIEVEVRNASKSYPILSRKRPNAYVIDKSQLSVVEKLNILGITVDTLKAETTLEVETFTVKEYNQDEELDEGVYQQKVKVAVEPKEILFPKGTLLVYLSQENANLAIEVLEPDAPNSFVNFGVLLTKEGALLPIYRYLKNEKL